MGHNNDDDKTKRYVDFLTDDENQDFDILNRAEVDESAEDFDPAAMSNSIELESSESEESQEHAAQHVQTSAPVAVAGTCGYILCALADHPPMSARMLLLLDGGTSAHGLR